MGGDRQEERKGEKKEEKKRNRSRRGEESGKGTHETGVSPHKSVLIQ